MTILDRLRDQVMARSLRYSTAISTTMDFAAGEAIGDVVRRRPRDLIRGVYALKPEPAGTAGNPLPGDKET